MRKLGELKKLESTPGATLRSIKPDEVVTAIIQVHEPDYVPQGVALRARIDESMFTAEMRADLLPKLEADPKVKSIALSRPQQLID